MSTKPTIQDLIKKLHLEPLPGEGGHFAKTYTHSKTFHDNSKERSLASAIYYAIAHNEKSAFHRVPCDEIFHFYAGDPVKQIQYNPETAELKVFNIGAQIFEGQQPQILVPQSHWQALYATENHFGWSLLGCTVHPGFLFEDFELAGPELLKKHSLLKPYAHLLP